MCALSILERFFQIPLHTCIHLRAIVDCFRYDPHPFNWIDPFVSKIDTVWEPMPVLLAVGLVVLLVEGHQVCQAEPIVCRDEVDGMGGPPVAAPLVAVTAAPPVVLRGRVSIDFG